MDQQSVDTEPRADQVLMLAYTAGDMQAFTRLYETHRKALFRFVHNGCGNQAIAAELYQDIWMRVVKHRASYTADAPFSAWLYRIARNRLTDHYRANATVPDQVPLNDDAQTSVTVINAPLQPDEIANLMERGESLSSAMQQLPIEQREAILLRHIAGMSVAEVADVVGENRETVKSRLRYATTKLRQYLRAEP
jgi:RNA polymerase sigma-70 factor (ECF subfamily)